MTTEYKVTFLPREKTISVPEGIALLEAARAAGVDMEAPCDGRGTCGKCRLKAGRGLSRPDETEALRLGDGIAKGMRLACRAKVHGDVRAELLTERRDTFVVLTEGQGTMWPLDPPVHQRAVEKSRQSGQQAIAGGWLPLFPDAFPDLLREMAAGYCQGGSQTAVMKDDRLLDWQRGPGRPCFGIALDIGTTSVVAELVNLATGESLGVGSCLNPQAEMGGDVLTRTSFASRQVGGVLMLQEKIVSGINRLIWQLTAAAKVRYEEIYELVVAGNTTMQHLFLGVDPWSLAQAPYRAVFTDQVEVSPKVVGVAIAPRGVVTVLPSAAAFVGADITAGLLAVGLHRYRKTALFIDIGTNGEIAVCKDGMLVGTSSAAGPALEGMNITCGCRAERGAIEEVSIDGDGTVNLKVIGGGTPGGICGSGLIDLIAELVRHGIILSSGRFAASGQMSPALASLMVELKGKPAFTVVANESIVITQKDVRQVQLAKGAIAAAIRLLLKELNLNYGDIDEVLVAGAFGFHLKPASLTGIGLLPHVLRNKIRFVGNTAKEGAKAVLLNRSASREIQDISRNIQIKELSLQSEFQEYFVKELGFNNSRTST